MSRAIRALVAAWCAVLLLVGSWAQILAQTPGVSADPSVEPVSLTTFDGLTPAQIWQEIDSLPFWAIPRDVPSGYYTLVDTSSAEALRTSLHAIIDDHTVFSYSNSSRPGDGNHVVDTWDVIALADAHPEHSDRVLDLYLNGTFDRQLRGTTSDPRYDREHSWPKSLGFPDQTTRNPAYSDCHHLFAAYQSYNSSRSNKPYGEREPDAERRRPTLENVGRGGAFMDDDAGSNFSFTDVWQTWVGRRGDVARAMFYLDVRYEGDATKGEADLQLTDGISEITQRDVWEQGGVAFMGLLPVLLEWHHEEPVDDLERRRMAVLYLFQGNRNPFVDHPEWVDVIYSGATLVAAEAWINEIHYDNAGADTGEFVEIAGPAGLDLSGWRLVGYNGNGGRQYKTVTLAGSIPDQASGFGALAFDFEGLQNGPPDGLALLDSNDRVVQFISYEGRFTAADGPAAGMESVDVGVSETASTPAGDSLQLTGSGSQAGVFQWSGPSQATPGAINMEQTFSPSN